MSDGGMVVFLKARLDEDEAAANEVHRPRDCGSVDRDGDFDPDPVWCGCGQPARVLREVAAKRAILAECDLLLKVGIAYPDEAGPESAGVILRHLAAVYSDHPDYRAEWKP